MPMIERWKYSLVHDIDPMEWDDFCLLADACKEINKAEAEARSKQR